MFGQMTDRPLLISDQIEFAARFHGSAEVVTRTVEGPIHRSTWGEVARRSRKLANALAGSGSARAIGSRRWPGTTHRHLELYFAVSGIGRGAPHHQPAAVRRAARATSSTTPRTAVLFFDTDVRAAGRDLAAARSRPSGRSSSLTDAAHLPATELPGVARSYEELIAPEPRRVRLARARRDARRRRCATPRARPATRRACCTATARPCCTPTRSRMPDALGLSGSDVTLPVVPMFHVNAWGVPYAARDGRRASWCFPGPGSTARACSS